MRMFVLSLALLLLMACKLEMVPQDAQFGADPTVTPVQPGLIDEASGLADSRSMPGNLWIEQDSGNPPNLTLLGYDGKVKGTMRVGKITNRDWEDIAIGPGPQAGVNYIYLAEIGDNNAQNPTGIIYRFPEPKSLSDSITQVERINFRYPDGPRDAEAIIVDPQTRDVYVISKREPNEHLYRLAYPQNINEVTTLEALGQLPNFAAGLPGWVTSAAISPDGNEILVRTYTQILYWKRKAGQSIPDALQLGTYRQMPARLEPQGEAICFKQDGSGYFTISERAQAQSVNLYFYARQ